MQSGWNAPVLRLTYRGAPQTIGLMARSALQSQNSYAIRSLAEAICGGLPSKAYVDEYLAIYYFVLGHCRYMRDPRTVELVRSPNTIARALWAGQRPSLDCDDAAAFLCALVLAVGGRARFVTVAFRHLNYQGQKQYTHVFVQAQEPQTKQWITLDPVAANKTSNMMRRAVAWKFWPVA